MFNDCRSISFSFHGLSSMFFIVWNHFLMILPCIVYIFKWYYSAVIDLLFCISHYLPNSIHVLSFLITMSIISQIIIVFLLIFLWILIDFNLILVLWIVTIHYQGTLPLILTIVNQLFSFVCHFVIGHINCPLQACEVSPQIYIVVYLQLPALLHSCTLNCLCTSCTFKGLSCL